MKIKKINQLAGYRSEMWLKTKKGTTFKYFSSTSGVDFQTAEENCFKRMNHFCNRCISHLEGKGQYWIEDHQKHIIESEKLTIEHFKKIKARIKPYIRGVEMNVEEINI